MMNESYRIFDTETTGLSTDWKAPVTDLNNWPRLVQLAWSHCDNSGNILSESDYIVKPQGFIIPADTENTPCSRLYCTGTSRDLAGW